uniref:ATP synthase subunit a n=1 Tax=Sycobia sp. 2 JXW-2020 TaxID=2781669 RepID=A0A8A6UP23_9HYME|nr:ATP synthase F0 subunit 6 [Sycobia sp. 2 JXW-2020]
MMNNLFSIFDPSTSMSYSLNWLSMIYVMLFMPMIYWLIPSQWNYFFQLIFNIIMNEMIMLLKYKENIINMIYLMSIFFLLLLNNFMGMFSYIFTASAHMSVNMSMSMFLWLNLMIFGWSFKTNQMFYHLVPQGTPSVLMSFMVIIETISNLIRPGTLAIRLSANMIAGHLLMTLISSVCPLLQLLPMFSVTLIQTILIILELSVSVIQAYVFMTLITLYMAEL